MRSWCALVLLVGSLVLATPAAPASAAPAWRGVITFDKNPKNPANSKVVWRLYQRLPQGGSKLVESRTWRAGSGMLGKAGRNSCVRNRGWLPNGSYAVRQHNDYHGNLIKGRAFRLDDARCGNGTRRQNLFLHTEQGARNRQCPNRKGDQVCRWEWPRYNDYKSAGCIKMSPRDLAELVRLYQKHFRAGTRYAKSQVVLRVVG